VKEERRHALASKMPHAEISGIRDYRYTEENPFNVWLSTPNSLDSNVTRNTV
tara:strand:+ start:1144 stop:1299 length:156 start_codon:yes stop_codon:yes gene_type:complete